MRTYLEIGTNDFDTLNDKFADRANWRGVSVEAVPEYFNRLTKLDKNQYVNAVCTEKACRPMMFYYVPASVIAEHNLPTWLRGCGSMDIGKQVSLQAYSKYVRRVELDTVAVEALLSMDIFTDKLTGRKRIDLLKIDTEGHDFVLLHEILRYVQPTNIIFEVIFMTEDEFVTTDFKLRELGYTCRGRDGDSIQYSIPSTLLIVDADWSTGSIAKDLRCISAERHVDFIDWKKYIPTGTLEMMISEYDSVVAFCLSSPRGWITLAKHGVVCCGKIEVDWVKDKELLGGCFGSVCYQTYRELLKLNVKKPVFYTPVTARMSRFQYKPIPTKIRTLGWCGLPASAQNFGGVDAKRYCMFEEIVEKTGLTPVVSYQDYNYDNMSEFYDKVDLLVCTSCTEGGPLGVFEAMACGIPVISTPVGVVLECPCISKFETADEAVQIIGELQSVPDALLDYRNIQTFTMENAMSTENLEHYWEDFFRECDRLNTNRVRFF